MVIYPGVKVVLIASRGKYGEIGVQVGIVTVWSMVVLATPTFTPTYLLLDISRSNLLAQLNVWMLSIRFRTV